MSDGFLAKYWIADISDHEWERRVATLRRTRSHAVEQENAAKNPALHDDLAQVNEVNVVNEVAGEVAGEILPGM